MKENLIRAILMGSISVNHKVRNLFKTGKGQYAEFDEFIGVAVRDLRKIAKEFVEISLSEVKELLSSRINEERLLGLLILILKYQRGGLESQDEIYNFYIEHLECVNNWNLVDGSAYQILGSYLLDKKKDILLDLAMSPNLWKRRVSIVGTKRFIENDEFDWTLKISEHLLRDEHDLIHKAVGWMLREVGKRDLARLVGFIEEHYYKMPRTTLRYAIERFPEDLRKGLLLRGS